MVFKGVSIRLGRIAPIVLGNELLKAAVRGLRGISRCLRKEPTPRAVELPAILGRLGRPIHANQVLHRKADVILSIRKTGDLCDRRLGHNFGYKDDTSSVLVP